MHRGIGGPFRNTEEWAFDVTVRNVTSASLCELARVDVANALAVAFDAKRKHYEQRCLAINARFMPLVMSTAGEFHPLFFNLVDHLAEKAGRRGSHGPLRWPLSSTTAFWKARFVAAVVRGMGQRVDNRLRVNSFVPVPLVGGVWSAQRWFAA